MNMKSWLGQIINKDQTVESTPLVITPRHDLALLESMTKKQLLAYAREHNIAINSRKRKEEIVTILMRT